MATVKKLIGRLPVYKGDWVAGSYSMLNQVTYLGSTFQSKIDNNTSQPATVVNNALQVNANWSVVSNGTAAYLADSRLTAVEGKTAQLEQKVNINNNESISYGGNTPSEYANVKYYKSDILKGDFTIIIDVQLENRSENQTIISKGTSSSSIAGFTIRNNKGLLQFHVNGQYVQHRLRDGHFHKYVFKKSGNELSIFCDNIISDRKIFDNISSLNSNNLAVGVNSYNQTYSEPFTGSFGNIAVYEYALTDSVIINKCMTNNIIDADYLLSPYNHLQDSTSDSKGNRITATGVLKELCIESTIATFLSFEKAKASNIQCPTIGRQTTIGRGDSLIVNTKIDIAVIDINMESRIKVTYPVYYIDDNYCGYTYANGYLKKTEDYNTWVDVIAIPDINVAGINPCNDGGLFIHSDPNDYEFGALYKVSKDRSKVSKVLQFRNIYQSNQSKWNLRQSGCTVFFSEYGNSPSNSGVGTKADATRIYKSSDYGETFSEFINLNNLTDVFPVDNNLHIHAIEIDLYDGCIWVTTGDGAGKAKSNKKLLKIDINDASKYSATELSSYYNNYIVENGGTPYDNLQGLSMHCMRDFILIGSDCYRNGIYRANKSLKNDFVEIEDAYELPIKNDITHFSGIFKKRNGVIYVSMATGDSTTPEGIANHRPFVIATLDGYNFTKIYECEFPRSGLKFFDVYPIGNVMYITEMYLDSFFVKKFTLGTI